MSSGVKTFKDEGETSEVASKTLNLIFEEIVEDDKV